MAFISFIYKIDNNKKTYYGKFVCDYISDDHEGLDNEIRWYVIDGINKYREQKELPPIEKIYIGVISFSMNRYIPTFSSDQEIQCFDFYYEKYEHVNEKTYINGKLIE
jgi:hypothetical protein